MELRQAWEARAREWMEWARTVDHDSFWQYYEAFYEEMVPGTPGRVLDLGCGEGRSTRAIVGRATSAIGIDSSPTLLRAAAMADSRSSYAIADARALPFVDDSFDTVVAYNSLMDLDDVQAGIAEAARVLRAQGHMCACVVHPMKDAGAFTSQAPDAPFVITGSYLVSRQYEDPVSRGGLEMTFKSWRHSLETYARSLEDNGLVIDRIREPTPKSPTHDGRWSRIPIFLFIRARKD